MPAATPHRTLLYFGQAPSFGTGSPPILLRHCQHLHEHGWQLELITNWGDNTAECQRRGWKLHKLPHRRAWWPPFRADVTWSRRLGTWLWSREVERLLGGRRPDAILTYLAWHTDLFPEIGAVYGRRAGVPVSCIIHDDGVDFTADPIARVRLRLRQSRILRLSHRNWFVSPEQAETMAPSDAHRGVLTPIPEGWAGAKGAWRPSFGERPRVYFAGYLWPPQAKLLAKLAPVIAAAGAQLVVLGRQTPEVDALVAAGLAEHLPPFRENHEALAHLTQHAAGLIASYAETVEEFAWTRTSMPSKVVEYSHLGIPLAIVAPLGTAVMNWAACESIPAAFAPDDHAGLIAWLEALKRPTSWAEQVRPWQQLATGAWTPAAIHAQLESELLRTPSAPAPAPASSPGSSSTGALTSTRA